MTNLKEIFVPDIGGSKNVDVIEVLVKPGDHVEVENPLITLEGDKATMEIPSPVAGTVHEVKVKVGDKVSQGSLILIMAVEGDKAPDDNTPSLTLPPRENHSGRGDKNTASKSEPHASASVPGNPTPKKSEAVEDTNLHASPAVRRLARETGVDLSQIPATGEKNRITKEDIQNYVKNAIARGNNANNSGLSIASTPVIDFTQFGDTETKPFNRIKKLTGANLHRNWVTVPHVTQFGQADITELEEFRNQQKAFAEKQGVKLTPIVFIMKMVVAALKAYPNFNASLDSSGEQLILKKYFNIGVAVDTPNGLVVPVIRDVDKKSLFALSKELAQISAKAREKGLAPTDMQGGCFTISSLGGIGGTAFTPIVNAPEVAILGVSKASIQAVYQNNNFVPRLMLPLSLSYDHRVIDGADGARFMVYLSEGLSDIRTLLL